MATDAWDPFHVPPRLKLALLGVCVHIQRGDLGTPRYVQLLLLASTAPCCIVLQIHDLKIAAFVFVLASLTSATVLT